MSKRLTCDFLMSPKTLPHLIYSWTSCTSNAQIIGAVHSFRHTAFIHLNNTSIFVAPALYFLSFLHFVGGRCSARFITTCRTRTCHALGAMAHTRKLRTRNYQSSVDSLTKYMEIWTLQHLRANLVTILIYLNNSTSATGSARTPATRMLIPILYWSRLNFFLHIHFLLLYKPPLWSLILLEISVGI